MTSKDEDTRVPKDQQDRPFEPLEDAELAQVAGGTDDPNIIKQCTTCGCQYGFTYRFCPNCRSSKYRAIRFL